jgi:hypothetical protein
MASLTQGASGRTSPAVRMEYREDNAVAVIGPDVSSDRTTARNGAK